VCKAKGNGAIAKNLAVGNARIATHMKKPSGFRNRHLEEKNRAQRLEMERCPCRFGLGSQRQESSSVVGGLILHRKSDPASTRSHFPNHRLRPRGASTDPFPSQDRLAGLGWLVDGQMIR
jgi:hypothetical protein